MDEETKGSERDSHLPDVTQLGRGKAGLCTKAGTRMSERDGERSHTEEPLRRAPLHTPGAEAVGNPFYTGSGKAQQRQLPSQRQELGVAGLSANKCRV